MASSKHFFVFLLLTLLSSIHIEARDNQMFNKIPSNTNELEKQIPYNKEIDNNPMNNPNVQQPNSLPENENSYGLYAHETVNLPPSLTTNNNNNDDDDNNLPNNAKYLPKNYNPVAYVTEPEDFNQDSTFSEKSYTNTPIHNNNYETNGAKNYHNPQQHGVKVFDFMDRDEDSTTSNNMNYNSYYKGYDRNNNFNHFNNRFMDASLATNNNNNNRFGGRVNRVQPQGMSDTRFLENGRYYYDINSEKYSVHPNENAMTMRNQYNPRGMFANHHANSYHYNNFNDAQVEYQDDNNMP